MIRRFSRDRTKRQVGLGLIELVIALALSSVLGLALFEVFRMARYSFDYVLDANEMLDNAQLSFAVLQDGINMAGFWNGADSQNLALLSSQLTAFPGNCNSQWVLNLEQGLRGYDGREQADAIADFPTTCLGDDYVPHSDVLVVRSASVLDPIDEKQLDNKDYEKRFIVRGSASSGGIVFQGKDVERAREKFPENSSLSNRLLNIDMFFLEFCESSESCDESGLSFNRYTLSGSRFVKQRLVSGIAQMQFEYAVAPNEIEGVTQYITADKVSDWAQVTSVRVYILLKGKQAGATYQTPEREFILGTNFIVDVADRDKQYKYKKFQSEFSLQNR